MADDIFREENRVKPTEGDIVQNMHEDTLYRSPDFKNGQGNIFNVVTRDEQGVPNELELELSSKIRISIVFIKDRNDINGITIKKFRYHKTRGWMADQNEEIKLSYFTFQKLIGFLKFITELDLKGITERRISLAEDDAQEIDLETRKKIKTLLAKKDGAKIVEEILGSDLLTTRDIVNLGYRKGQLEFFKKLLSDDRFAEQYRNENGIKGERREDVWQFFFEKNSWIFGYGLNYIFNEPLQGLKLEQVVSGADVSQSGKRADGFLKTRGAINSLCLVEIKTDKTPLLKTVAEPYRSNSWQISSELAGGVAQSQKTKQKSLENIRLSPKLTPRLENGDPTGEEIFAYQPKSYLVIGNLGEFLTENGINQEKFSSFELFRKNTSSPEVITFDELFERASFIVSHMPNGGG